MWERKLREAIADPNAVPKSPNRPLKSLNNLQQELTKWQKQKSIFEKDLKEKNLENEAALFEVEHEVKVLEVKVREKEQECKLTEIKIKEIKRGLRHSALRPLPSMRIIGNKESPLKSGVFQKKIVSGRVQYMDAELTEENMKLHNKQYSTHELSDMPLDKVYEDIKPNDDKYFTTPAGKPVRALPLEQTNINIGMKSTPREQSG